MDPLSVIASTIAVAQAISSTYKAIQHVKGLPKAFNEVNQSLPLVEQTLEAARSQLLVASLDEASAKAIEPVIKGCQEKANALLAIFQKIDNGKKDTKNGWVTELYRTVVIPLGKAHRVEALMKDILKGLKDLAINQLFKTATQSQMARLEKAIQELSEVEPSVSDSDFEDSGALNVTQNVAQGGTGNQAVNRGEKQENVFGNQFQSQGGAMSFGTDFLKKTL